MTVLDSRRMSEADRAGLAARSPEGHAAKSMHIRGREEEWIQIQANTFKNWVNVNLREAGLQVNDLATDFQDGVRLVCLVELLQRRKLRHNPTPQSQPHALENITIALDAIKEDGIKLVNIGNTDIQDGNVKLILGLIWSLIAHYQLGASNFPPKKLMLAWLKAVLPDCNIKNFTSDWNNGIALSALLEHCRPGLLPNWSRLSPSNGLENCRRAMQIAEREFKIPQVLEPEHFASPHLDELSGMTYLSYFMKEEDSPGYYSTLNWVKNQIPNFRINNFRTDWNDGLAACALVKSKGGPVPGFRDISNKPDNWTNNLDNALRGGQKLGVHPVLESRDISNPNVEYLGVMAWAAQFQWIPDKSGPADLVEMRLGTAKCKVGDTCEFVLDLDRDQVKSDQLAAKVNGPSGPVNLEFDPRDGKGHFIPQEFGMHEVVVTNEGEAVKGAPSFIRSMPNSKKDYDGIEPCAVGSTVEVLINPHHAARPDLLEVTAYSPTNRPLGCPVSEDNGTFYASFQPDEAGEWRIHVTYDNEDIENSPFKCMVFDPRAVFIPDQENARRAKPGEPFTFTVDASKSGWGEVSIDVVFDNKSIRRTFYVEEIRDRVYAVTFTPTSRGKHRVYVYLNGMEVKGSAFSLRIGKDIKESRTNKTESFKVDRKYKKLEEQKVERRFNNNYTEKEIFIEKPVAPPRSRRTDKRQSFRDFKDEQTKLFESEHQTEEGTDLLPVNRTIAFDCPIDGVNRNDIHVTITGPNGAKCPTQININQDGSGTFTCEFTTSLVGEHKIQIIIQDEQLNVTPSFYTYDASKIRVGQIPMGYIGLPVEFDISGTGAGFGNLEIIVNGGRVTSHVHTISKEQFQANFIPHDPGRHRVDVKFNGEKVPNSPWFVEVKDPNTPLLSPMLVANPTKAKEMENGSHDTLPKPKLNDSLLVSTLNNRHSSSINNISSLTNSTKNSFGHNNSSGGLNNSNSSSTLNNRHSSSQSKLNSELKQSSLFQQNQETVSKTSKFESSTFSSTTKPDLYSKTPAKPVDFTKSDFGTFSILDTPKLLLGAKSSNLEETKRFQSSSMEQLNSPRTTYSTTIERSINTNGISGAKESRFGGLSNGSSTMPKGSTFSKPIERRSSLHTKLSDPTETKPSTASTALTNGGSSFSKGFSNFESKGFSSSTQNVSSMSSSYSAFKSSSSHNTLEAPSAPLSPPSPKLTSYKGTADKCKFVGETVRHFNAGKVASFELFAPGTKKPDVAVNIISPEKRHIPHKVVDSGNGVFRIEFTTVEVGSYVIDVTVSGLSVVGSPLIAKAYDATLIKVTDISDAVVGDLSSFRVDASKAGEGQLEISINDGDVPNAVQVLGGGKCLVTFTPDQAITHEIEVMFNNDQVPGSPFLCRVKDEDDGSYVGSSGSFSRVQVELDHLGLVAVGQPAEFTIRVPEGADAELAVSVQGPVEDIPVKVTGNVKNGFVAQFIPSAVGLHVVLVEYNGVAVGGTPYYSKAYDSEGVGVSDIPRGTVGKTVTFAVDASEAGEGNLEILVSALNTNIPTRVEPLGDAKFQVSFVPRLAALHQIFVTFNDENIQGSPFESEVIAENSLTTLYPDPVRPMRTHQESVRPTRNLQETVRPTRAQHQETARPIRINSDPLESATFRSEQGSRQTFRSEDDSKQSYRSDVESRQSSYRSDLETRQTYRSSQQDLRETNRSENDSSRHIYRSNQDLRQIDRSGPDPRHASRSDQDQSHTSRLSSTHTNNEGGRQTVREVFLESGPSYEYQVRETRQTYRHPDGGHSSHEEETRQSHRYADLRRSNQELQDFRHSSQDLRSHLPLNPGQEFRQTTSSQEVRNSRGGHESQADQEDRGRLNVGEERAIPISKDPKTVRSHVALHKDPGSRAFRSPDPAAPKDPNESRRVRSHVTRSYESSQIYKGSNRY